MISLNCVMSTPTQEAARMVTNAIPARSRVKCDGKAMSPAPSVTELTTPAAVDQKMAA